MNLTGSGTTTESLIKGGINPFINRLETLVDRERLHHSLGACHTMLILCRIYEEDSWKGAILGLAHDAGRCKDSSRMRELLEEFGYPLSGEDLFFPKIWHARLGAVMLKECFGMENDEMAEAIRVHPTGSPGMSRMGKLLFIADYIEPTRDFEGVTFFRTLAHNGLEEAFKAILKNKVDHVRSRGKPLHSDSLKALEFYMKEGEKAY